jgi:hypothetical protein
VTVVPFRRKWPPWYQGWQWMVVLVLLLSLFVAAILS